MKVNKNSYDYYYLKVPDRILPSFFLEQGEAKEVKVKMS